MTPDTATATLRPATAQDLDALHALIRRIEAHDGLPLVTPRTELDEWVEDPHLDLALDTRLAESQGRLVGWARIWHEPSGVDHERAYLFGGVDPDHRRRGIGSRLFAWQLERGTERLAAATSTLPRYLRAHGFAFQEADLALYTRHGMPAVRFGDELLRDLEDLPEVPEIDGVTLAAWDPARSEEIRVATNDGFADHWGSTPRDAAAWEHLLASHGNRPDLSFLALAEDRVVGVCRNAFLPDDEKLSGRREGWIAAVSVVRDFRRRGIASALVARSLHAFRDGGFSHSMLGVDSENPTGAFRIYARLGYRPLHRTVTHQREV